MMDLQAIGYLRELVAAPKDRVPLVSKAAALSLDAYDCLRLLAEGEHGREAGQDWIGTRYWAREVLGVILRTKAVHAWKRAADGFDWEDPGVLLEALASFTSDPLSYEAGRMSLFVPSRWSR